MSIEYEYIEHRHKQKIDMIKCNDIRVVVLCQHGLLS